jgi:predicted TIM-barrel fold metal-dependent hydrolase
MAETFIKNMQSHFDGYSTSFDDYLKFMFTIMEKIREQGCVALKMAFGYWRGINVDVVSEDEARSVFEAKDVSSERYKRLQDYLLRRILAKASEIGLPVQIHSGCTGVESFMKESDPSCLDKLLWFPDVRPARVVLLHGGYPFCREAGFMVSAWGRSPRQLYLDLSLIWMEHPCSPYALVGTLREWLEMGLASKLIYGSDGTSPFKLWISAMDIREALYIVLKGMIDDGLISESQALSMAEQILRGNAETVYRL